MKPLIISLVLFLVSAFCYAEDIQYLDRVKTRFGILQAASSWEGGPKDKLLFNGQTVFDGKGQFVSIHGYFRRAQTDVAIFGVNCGGSSCSPDELHFVILKPHSNFILASDPGFYSNDATVRPIQTSNVVRVDLGFENGVKKVAELKGEKVQIHHYPQPTLPLTQSVCENLYEYALNECARFASLHEPCGAAPDSGLSVAYMNEMRALIHHPGFVTAKWNESCISRCEGKEISYEDFKTAVCSIKTP
jgi:hypothetical protein